jgi:hypothetical protein
MLNVNRIIYTWIAFLPAAGRIICCLSAGTKGVPGKQDLNCSQRTPGSLLPSFDLSIEARYKRVAPIYGFDLDLKLQMNGSE